MTLFLIISILLGLTALFGLLNERLLRLQPSIGLMLLALIMSLSLVGLESAGVLEALEWEETLVRELDLSSVLLNGVLCFMRFAGSAALRIEVSGPIAMVVAFSVLVPGSTISRFFEPSSLRGLLV